MGRLAEMIVEDLPKWRVDAKCMTHEEDPELFFPDKGGAALAQSKSAKAVCNGTDGSGFACPVLDQCREWALINNERFGVWGGMSEQERAQERRRRRLVENNKHRQKRRKRIVRRPPGY